MILKQGLVLLFEEGGFVQRDIRVENGVIAEIAPEIAPKADEEIFDAAGKYITPGLIDAHSHICISEEGMGGIGDDCNDYPEDAGPCGLAPPLAVLPHKPPESDGVMWLAAGRFREASAPRLPP